MDRSYHTVDTCSDSLGCGAERERERETGSSYIISLDGFHKLISPLILDCLMLNVRQWSPRLVVLVSVKPVEVLQADAFPVTSP